MIVTEFYKTREDGIRLMKTYSDAGKMIERDGVLYEEAIDPEGSGRMYAETEIEREFTEEDALSVITGG